MPPKPSVPLVPPKSKLGICSRILRPMQTTRGICWFLTVIVIMFYSQRSRRVIMEASKTWNRRNKVIKLFIDLLYGRYLTVGSDPYKDEEHETFNEDTFIEILQRLYDMDSSNFPINPKDDDKGYYVDSYLCKLYTLLGVDYKAFDYDPISKDIYYSSINKEFDSIYKSISNTIPHSSDLPYLLDPNVGVYKDDGHAPSILIISRFPLLTPFANNKIVDDDVKSKLTSMNEKITYNGYEYNLDSVHISNMEKGCKHSIVGMTCKNKKFIFNGHPLNNNNFPCVLIPHNWNIRNDRDFYLSSKDCELHYDPQRESLSISYNFSQGYQRGFIYVRKNAIRDTSNSLEEDVEKYFETRKDVVRLEEEIERARLLYEEKERKEIEARKEQMRRFSLFSEKRKKEDQERRRLFFEEKEREKQEKLQKEREKQEKQEKQEKLQRELLEREEKQQRELLEREEKQQRERELRIKEDNFASNLKNIEAFMAKLKLDDRREPKRKRNSGSNSSPKLIKKQDIRASPQKAKTKTIIKRHRYIRKTMI